MTENYYFLNVHRTLFCYLSKIFKSFAVRTERNCYSKKVNYFQVLLADFKKGFKINKKENILFKSYYYFEMLYRPIF